MKPKLTKLTATIAGAALLALAGCGGSSGDSSPAATTATVPITVADASIQNAVVCLDKNLNGGCDAGEPKDETNSAGVANLVVDMADVGKYPVVADVGTGATAFVLKAPADHTAVVSSLTSLVQSVVETNGLTSTAAETVVRARTGINVSLFEDFTKSSSADSMFAAAVARALVVTTQQQLQAVNAALETKAPDDTLMTRAVLNQAVSRRIQELLPDVLAILADPSVTNAATPEAKEAAILAGGQALISQDGLTAASVGENIAIYNQATMPPAATTPSANFQLTALNFTDAINYNARYLSQSLAQATPDATGNDKFVERRYQRTSGVLMTWGSRGSPARNADVHWNGSAWVNCPINFESTSSARDAQGTSAYDSCGKFQTGQSNRATVDVSGKSMASVIAQARAAGHSSISIGDNSTAALNAALGSTTFGEGSSVFYQTTTPLTNAMAYYPGTDNRITQYSAEVTAGGVASMQPAGTGCNSTEYTTDGALSTTLEGMVAAMTGTPCVFASPTSFVYNAVTYTSPDPTNESWGNSTTSIGKLGTAPVGTGAAPGYYSGNTRLRVAFKGTGVNPVTYYACKERFNTGSTRNCSEIGTGSYTISTLGDGRVLTLNSLPPQVSQRNWAPVFVERGGFVFLGYQDMPSTSKNVRLNTVAATALLNQLGLTADIPDPSTPLMTTMASYAGSYRGTYSGTDSGTFSTSMNSTGKTTCSGVSSLAGNFSCTFAVTPATPSTADITIGIEAAGATFTGVLDFNTGNVSGNWSNNSASGTFAGTRR